MEKITFDRFLEIYDNNTYAICIQGDITEYIEDYCVSDAMIEDIKIADIFIYNAGELDSIDSMMSDMAGTLSSAHKIIKIDYGNNYVDYLYVW